MRWVGIIYAALALLLSSTNTWSADKEMLPMRGNSPNGKTMINAFQPLLEEFGFANMLHTEARPSLIAAENKAHKQASEITLQRQPYLEWKNSCELPPVKIGGSTFAMPAPDGFLEVAPYVEVPEATGKSYMEILAHEFSDIIPPHPTAE